MLLGKSPAIALGLFTLMLPAGVMKATTVTYSTYQSWNGAVSNPIELNFTAISSSASYSTSTGITLSPMSGASLPFVFTGPSTAGYQLTGGTFTSRNIVSLYGPSNGTGTIMVNLPSGGENAILLALGATNNATSMTVSLSDGTSYNVTPVANTSTFFGVSISHDVTWLSIGAPSQPLIDDFFFANSKLIQDAATSSAQPTPTAFEGSTFSLIGGGLLSFIGFRRKLRLGLSAA